MRMKKIVENRTLKSAAAEFLAFKRAQKIRERTLHDYQKYINPFVEQSSNSMDIDVLKREILEYFANIPATSPARYNHPYQYLHALFAWCAKQDYHYVLDWFSETVEGYDDFKKFAAQKEADHKQAETQIATNEAEKKQSEIATTSK